MEHGNYNDTSPLLGSGANVATRGAPPEEQAPRYQLRKPWHICLLIGLSAILWAISASVVTFYLMSHLFDDLEDYGGSLFSLNANLSSVCGLVVAVPFGILADRARKPVYILASAGQILSIAWVLLLSSFYRVLPFNLVWLGALGQLLGGGLIVINVIHVSILADVLPAERRLLGFLLLTVVHRWAPLAALPLLDVRNGLPVQAPLILSLALAFLSVSLVVLLPETAQGSIPRAAENENGWSGLKSRLYLRFRDLGPALAIARRTPVPWVLLAIAALTPAVQGYWMISQVYLEVWFTSDSRRWETTLITLVTHFVTEVILLPILTLLLVHPRGHARFSGYQRDLVLASIAAFLGIAGIILTCAPGIGFMFAGVVLTAPSAVVNTLCLSLLSYLVPSSSYGMIYGLAYALQTLCAVSFTLLERVIIPLLNSKLFPVPFLILAAFELITMVALFQLKFRPGQEGVLVQSTGGTANDEVRGRAGEVQVTDRENDAESGPGH